MLRGVVGLPDSRSRCAWVTTVDGIKKHMAVKNDLTGLEVWIPSGLLSAIVVGASIAAMVVKAFYSK